MTPGELVRRLVRDAGNVFRDDGQEAEVAELEGKLLREDLQLLAPFYFIFFVGSMHM